MKILQNNTTSNVQNPRTCNCINKFTCPLNNNCLIENIVYQATITSNESNYEPKFYIGISESTFKKRFANHKKSFNIKKYEKDTELSKEYWKIKEKNYTPLVTWKIIKKCSPYNPNTKRCHLCLNEKLEIAQFQNNTLLNKRSELVSKCRHETKYTLIKHDSKD